MFVLVMMFHVGPEDGGIVEEFSADFTGDIFTLQVNNIAVSLQVCLQMEFPVAILEITVEFWLTVNVHVLLQHPHQFECFPTFITGVVPFLLGWGTLRLLLTVALLADFHLHLLGKFFNFLLSLFNFISFVRNLDLRDLGAPELCQELQQV